MDNPIASTISSYMHGDLPLHQTISTLQTTTTNAPSQESLWSTILSTSKTCPRKGPTLSSGTDLNHLVVLLSALKDSTSPDAQTISFTDFETLINTQIRSDHLPNTADGAEIEAWENVNAFLAVITKKRIVGCEGLGIAALKQALEVPYFKDAREQGALDVYVTVAGIWGIIMGEELWEREREGVDEDGISTRRWEYWTERLQFMSLWEDLKIGTREVAAEAAAVMHRVKY